MSTFPGPLSEFPGVSVDRFDGENRASSVFFLSHCHTDHMYGLEDLQGLPGPLFVSEISTVILRRKFSHLTDVRTLEIGVETAIDIRGETVHVTTIPAGHCPGSVMFLFESPGCRVLYTGDFRLREKDVRNVKVFQRIRSNLDCVYVDSTFLDKGFAEFPSRMDSTNAIVARIQQWTGTSPNHIVWINTPARYGSEFLFREIHRRTKKSLHIDLDNLSSYCHIPDMDGVFVLDGQQSQVHACWKPGCSAVRHQGKEVCEIRPSALFWRNWKTTSCLTKSQSRIFRVCYSSHSSLAELKDFIGFLKPRKVELNVVPKSAESRAEMFSVLREILAGSDAEETPKSAAETTEEISFRNIKLSGSSWEEKLSEEFDNEIMCLPKRKKL
ncbi:protein artemis-like [Phlebotomus argentipes]|uniref:protein artemis-like n=1 Tax=Phlebotomus argentipes TaxID=94469 RepID=UPI002893790B|nr:protein artemis-like [Phlebotomus argentipes]